MKFGTRLDEIKYLHKEATEAYFRAFDTGSCADEDIVTDKLSELFVDEHTDWLIEQAEMIQKIELEIDNSDMGTAIDNIIKIIKG